jgi:hypothetical protein
MLKPKGSQTNECTNIHITSGERKFKQVPAKKLMATVL